MPPADDLAKNAIRHKMWTMLEREGAAPPGAYGYIPRFAGADRAAARLAELEFWRRAQIVKSNPDRAQLPVRVLALRAGKLLYMAVPRIATVRPFYLLDPHVLAGAFEEVATGQGAAGIAPTVDVADMPPVDVVIAGSVAVNPQGARIGKGGGFSDIEIALLTEAGLIRPDTTIVTTVHELQVVDDELPETEHDFGVDVIVTPDRVIHCVSPKRPDGVVPDHLDDEKIREIPALARFLGRAGPSGATVTQGSPERPAASPSAGS